MILDAENEFSDSQVVTATAISTNVIDLGDNLTLHDVGADDQELVVQVDVDVAAAGAATVTFSLESDSTADLATAPTVHQVTAAIAKADLTAGTELRFRLPKERTYQRYLGVRYTVATGPLTTGSAFSSFLTPLSVRAETYPDNSPIS